MENETMEVSNEYKTKLVEYLRDPVGFGLWHLTAIWEPDGGISFDVWSLFEESVKGKKELDIKDSDGVRKIHLNESAMLKFKEACSTMTFIFSLFSYITNKDRKSTKNEEEKQETITSSYPHLMYKAICENIEINTITLKYSKALDYFKNNINNGSSRYSIPPKKPIKIKNGIFILLELPRERNSLKVVSWKDSPLNDVKKLLELTGKIKEIELMPVFSPEEDVLFPFFALLEMAEDQVVSQSNLQRLLNKAISNFNESSFTDCVSAFGLASEDVLTQIYETLYREPLNKGLTLGQLVDELHIKAAVQSKKKDTAPPDLTIFYSDIKNAIEDPELSPTRSLELLRNVLTKLVEVNKHTNERIDKIGRQEKKICIWPDHVNHTMTELIKYRNAASHKSRVPIGPMECRRAAHSFVVLTQWWFHERTKIDWSKSPEDIIKHFVNCNS